MNRRKFLTTAAAGGATFGISIYGGMRLAGAADDSTFRPDQRKAADRVLPERYRRLLPLHQPKAPPQPGDWLDQHDERGQDYRTYITSRPTRADRVRNKIYLLPLGEFDAHQKQVFDRTAQCMGIFFGLQVKTVDPPMSLDTIPETARRVHPVWGDKQILTTYVLDNILKKHLPSDACAFLALTTSDLWLGKGWNFVFGQARYRDRVGVQSIYRNGVPSLSRERFLRCLKRTIKTATHETAHIFSMPHCTYYQCNVNGSNNRIESDRAPLALCPHCLGKLVYATDIDPVDRYRKLAAFYTEVGMPEEAIIFTRSAALLGG